MLRVVPGDRPLDLPVGRLDEAVLVDPAVGRERADEADVRAFRRLDRADPAVVAGWTSRTSKPARSRDRPPGPRAERRRLWVSSASGLVWSMNWRQLAAAEELLHRGHDRPDVDQRVRGRLVDLLDRHPLADDALHPQQADPERVLDQLADRADAAVAEMVDVVRRGQAALSSIRWPTIAAMSSRVIVRCSRGSSMPIRRRRASSFLLNL